MASSVPSIPDEYICPITRDIMKNPVILIEDGCSYEESAVQSWLQNHNTSPMTNNQLNNRNYTPNRALKSLIENFCAEQTSLVSTQQFLAFDIRAGRIPRSDWKHQPTIRINLSLLGASGVGKTVLAHCLQHRQLPDNIKTPPSTAGIDILFFHLDRLFQNEYVVIIQLNDPPGQDRYQAVTNPFFKQCHGALLLADTTRLESLERLEQYWYKKLEELSIDNVQTVLVCTKIDLFEKEDPDYRGLFLHHAEKFAFLHQMPIVQVSAYRGDNVQYVFKQLIMRIMTNETLVHNLIAHASRPDDSINRRRNSLSTRNFVPLELSGRHRLREQRKKKQPKCCD